MKRFTSNDFSVGMVFVMALAAAFAVGAWQGLHDTRIGEPAGTGAEQSAFVESGGLVADADRHAIDVAKAPLHARVPALVAQRAAIF